MGQSPASCFTNNLLQHNAYGIFGSGQSYGNGTLAYYAPGAVVQGNVMATNSSVASRYPPDNLFPSLAAFNATFQNAAATGLPPCGRQPLCGRRNRRQEHRLRLHDACQRRCRLRSPQTALRITAR